MSFTLHTLVTQDVGRGAATAGIPRRTPQSSLRPCGSKACTVFEEECSAPKGSRDFIWFVKLGNVYKIQCERNKYIGGVLEIHTEIFFS